ncbi:MAG: polysaccharide biosynthesis C-terminal domain-containing protein [Acidobacteriota bacterium]
MVTEGKPMDRSSLATLVVFVLCTAPVYAVHVCYARFLGAAAYGDVSVAVSVATLVSILALGGLDRAALKFLPIYGAADDRARTRGFLRVAGRTVALRTLALAVGGWLVVSLIERIWHVEEHPIRWSMWIMPAFVMIALVARLGAASGRPALVSGLRKLATPVVMVGAIVLLHHRGVFDERLALTVEAGSRILVVLVMVGFVWPLFRGLGATAPVGDERPAWLATAHSFLFAVLVTRVVQRSGLLVLELLHANEHDVGIYSAATATAELPLMVLGAVRIVSIPLMSRDLKAGDRVKMAGRIHRDVKLLAGVGLLSLLVWIVFGDAILGYFGLHFGTAHATLVILGFALLSTLGIGFAMPILQLLDEHRLIYRSLLVLLIGNLALTFALVPLWGPIGAALGFAVPTIAVNVHQAWVLRNRYPEVGFLRAAAGGDR